MDHALPRRALLGGSLTLAACAAPAPSGGPGPQGAEGWEMREQVWRIPVPARIGATETVLLEATLFRPPGPDQPPRPVVLLNHGQPGSAALRRQLQRPRYPQAAGLFLAEGLAVLIPTRRGFGASGGEFLGGTGGCERLDLLNNADTAANDIAAVLRWLPEGMPFLDSTRVLLAGQSAGGFGSLSAAGRDVPGIAGVVNFSGGLRAGDGATLGGQFCPGWQDALLRAMETLGRRAAPRQVPTLWLYATNDNYFGYGLAPRLAEAWLAGGGRARFTEIATTARDGHGFIEQDGTLSLWRGPVRGFLAELRAAGRL